MSKSSELLVSEEEDPVRSVHSDRHLEDRRRNDAEGATGRSVTLISALQNKYSTSSMQSMHCQIFIASNAPGKTASGTFRVPENLTLDCCGITSAGLGSEVAQLCADVVELDLAQNNITSWLEVWTILEEIPRLEFLNLTRNPLPQLSSIPTDKRYPNLKKLVLNFTNLTWRTIQNLLITMPSLEELYLSGNSYDDVMLDLPAYTSLRLLQLTDNKLSDWSHVVKLDQLFPSLNNLILANNNISHCGSAEENTAILRNLKVLNMNNTAISNWDDLDKLSSITSVSDVRLVSIPLVEDFDEVKRRQMVVVYFPHASRLNGSAITDSERDTAERVYLRHFQDLSSKAARYAVLVRKHGTLDPLTNVTLQPASTVAMTVVCDDKEELFDIPTKQTIGQLKTSLRKFVGCKRFRLYHDDKCQGPSEIRSNNRFVWALNFRDGETLICDKVEPPSPTGSQPSSPRKSQPVNTRRSVYSGIREGDGMSIENIPPSPSKEPPSKKR